MSGSEILLSRREFLKWSTLASAGATLIACNKPPIKPALNVRQATSIELPTSIDLTTEDEMGTPLAIEGTIYADANNTLLSGAFITVWHTDTEGEYGTYRGTVQSNEQGVYQINTIKPSGYQVDATTKRAAHIHFEISAPGMQTVSGEILFEGDPDLKIDPVVLETEPEILASRIISLTMEEGSSASFLQGRFDVVLKSR